MPSRRPDADAIDQLLRENPLSAQEFRDRLYAAQHGAAALRNMRIDVALDGAASRYGEALAACRARIRDGSIQPYQFRSLLHAYAEWRRAWRAAINHHRPATAAAE